MTERQEIAVFGHKLPQASARDLDLPDLLR
jgi:hypothetical protein